MRAIDADILVCGECHQLGGLAAAAEPFFGCVANYFVPDSRSKAEAVDNRALCTVQTDVLRAARNQDLVSPKLERRRIEAMPANCTLGHWCTHSAWHCDVQGVWNRIGEVVASESRK